MILLRARLGPFNLQSLHLHIVHVHYTPPENSKIYALYI